MSKKSPVSKWINIECFIQLHFNIFGLAITGGNGPSPGAGGNFTSGNGPSPGAGGTFTSGNGPSTGAGGANTGGNAGNSDHLLTGETGCDDDTIFCKM